MSAVPPLTRAQAAALALELYGLAGPIEELPSYQDRNFLIGAPGQRAVFKVSNGGERPEALELQHRAMERLAPLEIAPTVIRSRAGREVETVTVDGRPHLARALSFIEGTLWSGAAHVGDATWKSLGETLARVDLALADLEHPCAGQTHRWDLASAAWTIGRARRFGSARQALLELHQREFLGHVMTRLEELPRQVIHNDANDYNLLVCDDPPGKGGARVSGLIDFGDALHTARVFELAIAGAYLMCGCDDPLASLAALTAAYDGVTPLGEAELAVLFPAACMRLVVSVTAAGEASELAPANDYINVSADAAWATLEVLARTSPAGAERSLRAACGRASPLRDSDRGEVAARRARHVSRSLSLSYSEPLLIVRGRGSYLFDERGRAQLDCVNNVCHVGHSHPRVVAAAAEQMAALNTNTRYLHPNLGRYAERLAGLLPDPLSVCFFVNSGSEAGELALRLARAATGRRDVVVVEGGYHGHTSALIDLSHYKHAGPGGAGTPDWVRTTLCPDTYRGSHRGQPDDPVATEAYLSDVERALEACRPAAFLAEPLIGCGGQIVPPAGWLAGAFERARARGAVCIADEVQVGFGRVGSHWWAFEQQRAVPDIVTLGKPIGNGHPMGAVVTTREIASAFDNGMEFFSTCGGNPVSCAVGLAVLDVIEDERLCENAARVGARLRDGLRELGQRHAVIGDVRGVGLYLGVELVRDRGQRRPDAGRLARLLDRCRDAGVLLSSDGPDHNVLKIKPPLCFGLAEAELLLEVLDGALTESG